MTNLLKGKSKLIIYPPKGINVVIPKEEGGLIKDQSFFSDNLPKQLEAIYLGEYEEVLQNGKKVRRKMYFSKEILKELEEICLDGKLKYKNAGNILDSICQALFEGSIAEDGRKVCRVTAFSIEEAKELLECTSQWEKNNNEIIISDGYLYQRKGNLSKISKEIENLIFLEKPYWLPSHSMDADSDCMCFCARRARIGTGLNHGLYSLNGDASDHEYSVRPVFHL